MRKASMRLTQSPTAVLTVWLLCGIGIYASARMLRKLRRSERGELTEASVVTSPAAKLFFGIPNALLGLLYYAFLIVAVLFEANGAMRVVILGAASIAVLTSIALGYDLLFRTRRSCVLCWTSHAVNAALFLSVLFVENIY